MAHLELEKGMRMRLLSITVALVAFIFGACGGADEGTDPKGQNEAASSDEDPSPTTPGTSSGDAAEGAGLTLSVSGGGFNPDSLRLTANEATKLSFANNDPAPHNMSIYVTEGGKNLFKGETVDATGSTIYDIPPLKKGRYYFTCDIHPPMEGTVVAQ